jgi:Rieske 2Fe-2S family protein
MHTDVPLAPEVPATYLLPPSAYTDPAWFELEHARLFDRRWTPVAAVDELTATGDYAAAVVGSAPLVVIRGEGGELRAFHNLCRHRGMVLLEGSGNVGASISCFYHQWRYSLDGDLRVVPQRREQLACMDPQDWGLLPASVAVWEGLVFAHPDPSAPPLTDTLGALPEHIGSHSPGRLVQVATATIDAACNWKLFVENHVDVYHLWYLHAESLGDFDHCRFEHRQVGPNWASYEPVRGGNAAATALARGTVPISGLADRDRLGFGAHLVFPNLMMASSAEFFATYLAVPVAPDLSRIELRVRAEPGSDGEALLAATRSFIEEDISACERVQAAVRSPWFQVGPLCRDHERPITVFHRHVLDALGDAVPR